MEFIPFIQSSADHDLTEANYLCLEKDAKKFERLNTEFNEVKIPRKESLSLEIGNVKISWKNVLIYLENTSPYFEG